MAVGAAGDELLAFDAARITAIESRAIGVHVNFSPIADVNNNAKNPVINTRAFGEQPDVVGRMTAAYVRGLRAGGMLSTLKHFPGHGDTDVDSHLGLPIINRSREQLEAVELAPFRQGIAAGADAIMVAHIELPALDPAEFSPATLSRPIVTDLLRNQMKFNGLIYTDSMGMDAVSKRLSPGTLRLARSWRATTSCCTRRMTRRPWPGSRRRWRRARSRSRSSTNPFGVCCAQKPASDCTSHVSCRWTMCRRRWVAARTPPLRRRSPRKRSH
jgi:beta-glucosidase-like glycosyl hydrolase